MRPPQFRLDEPGTIAFTAERAYHGQRLTAFCLSLREERNRAEFLADQQAYMDLYGLDESARELVTERDWTGLLMRGAHLQAVLKLSATFGGDLFDIGAHNVGVAKEELLRACPRIVSQVPEGR